MEQHPKRLKGTLEWYLELLIGYPGLAAGTFHEISAGAICNFLRSKVKLKQLQLAPQVREKQYIL